MVRKYTVYECDVCGKEEQADGFPEEWIEIEVRKGAYFSSDEDFEKHLWERDCCRQECANKAMLAYLSAHRFEGG
uniref:Uncharacterized protein n=1 Tax=viral metagenome TaxID=1070528 RepID=A0A6M3L9X6_9ZZZZ